MLNDVKEKLIDNNFLILIELIWFSMMNSIMNWSLI